MIFLGANTVICLFLRFDGLSRRLCLIRGWFRLSGAPGDHWRPHKRRRKLFTRINSIDTLHSASRYRSLVMATISDLPPEIMLMVTAYLQGEDVLNLQLTDRRMNSLTTAALYRIFFSERHFELSSRGFEQLYALSVNPHARHV